MAGSHEPDGQMSHLGRTEMVSVPIRRILALALICVACSPHISWADVLSPCQHCDLIIGVGTTFRYFAWTDGVVVPVMLELDDSRWELGAFRLATAQRFADSDHPPNARSADPYWGFTAMRRWRLLNRQWGALYVGCGANYRTETDQLVATRWNFAYLAAARFRLGSGNKVLELGIRHWSNAWIRLPDRGQNLVTLSFGF